MLAREEQSERLPVEKSIRSGECLGGWGVMYGDVLCVTSVFALIKRTTIPGSRRALSFFHLA